MDEYLTKYGFSPNDMGLNRYLQTEKSDTSKSKDVGAEPKSSCNTNENLNSNNFCNEMLKNLPLTMAYVPLQKYQNIYSQSEALNIGTLFPELNKPFLGKRP